MPNVLTFETDMLPYLSLFQMHEAATNVLHRQEGANESSVEYRFDCNERYLAMRIRASGQFNTFGRKFAKLSEQNASTEIL